MVDSKVNLSLLVPGAGMLSEQECSKNPKKNCYDYFQMKVCDSNNKNCEVIKVAVRKSRTIKQNIKLSKEAFDYMTDATICPDPKLKGKWKKFTINQRLEYHCKLIADTLGATSFSFEVLDD